MKSTLVVIGLFFSALCIGQTAPANPAPDQAPPAAQNAPMNARRPPGVAGTITAIDANVFTIKTRDGESAQVTLNDKTQYRKDRAPAKLSDFKVGDTRSVNHEHGSNISPRGSLGEAWRKN